MDARSARSDDAPPRKATSPEGLPDSVSAANRKPGAPKQPHDQPPHTSRRFESAANRNQATPVTHTQQPHAYK